MSARVFVGLKGLAGLSVRRSIFSIDLKPSTYLHATPDLCSISHFSSKAQAKIVTIPNFLTSLRIGATPFIVYLIVRQDLPSAAILAAVIGLTDAADGYIARRFPSQQSVAGSYLDPLADKLFISSVSVTMAYSDLLPVSLVTLFLLRDALLLVGASYVRFVSLGRPLSALRLLFPKERVIEMKPTNSSKVNTALQITTVFSSLVAPVLELQDSLALPALWMAAASTTIYSGFGYAQSFPKFLREAVEISASKKK